MAVNRKCNEEQKEEGQFFHSDLSVSVFINSNIKRVVYIQPYPDTDALEFFSQAGVEVVNMPISDFA